MISNEQAKQSARETLDALERIRRLADNKSEQATASDLPEWLAKTFREAGVNI